MWLEQNAYLFEVAALNIAHVSRHKNSKITKRSKIISNINSCSVLSKAVFKNRSFCACNWTSLTPIPEEIKQDWNDKMFELLKYQLIKNVKRVLTFTENFCMRVYLVAVAEIIYILRDE